MIEKKKYLKSRPVCKVKFTLPSKEAKNAKKIFIVGDFNAWDKKATPLKKLKNGSYSVILELPVGKDYQFRFFLDEKRWINDSAADDYAPSPYAGIENSVVSV